MLYITTEKYRSKYQLLASNTIVHARANLVDAHTGAIICEGFAQTVYAVQSGLIQALVEVE